MGYERLVNDIRKNLIFAMIALIIILVNLVLSTISTTIFNNYIEENPTVTLIIVWTINISTLIFFITAIILQFIWVIRSYQLTSKKDPGLKRDSRYGIIFISLYTGYFILYPFLLMQFIFNLAYKNSNLALYHYVNSFIGLTFLFINLFVFIFPVRRLITKGQRIALIFGSILIIVISLQTSRVNYDSTGVLLYFDTFLRFAGWATILIVYFRLFGKLRERGSLKGPYETELKKGLKKEGWKRRFTLISDRKPQYLILFLAVIIGANSAFGYFMDKDDYNKDVWTPIGFLDWDDEYEPPTGTFTYSASGAASEGDGYLYDLYLENYPAQVEITIRWEDEPDTILWENQPDTFGLTVDHPDGSEEGSDSNPQGGEGEIFLSFSSDSLGDLNITVDLLETGNYERPVGPGFLTRTDGGNNYELQIVIMYPDPEE